MSEDKSKDCARDGRVQIAQEQNQWQPARILIVHADATLEEKRKTASRVMRVKEINAERVYRKGCDARRFFVMHPDDVFFVTGDRGSTGTFCEHEVLTD